MTFFQQVVVYISSVTSTDVISWDWRGHGAVDSGVGRDKGMKDRVGGREEEKNIQNKSAAFSQYYNQHLTVKTGVLCE